METEKILLFVKYPEPGRVKTRLESRLGKACAAGLYICFVLDILETLHAAGSGCALSLVFAPPEGGKDMALLLSPSRGLHCQPGRKTGLTNIPLSTIQLPSRTAG